LSIKTNFIYGLMLHIIDSNMNVLDNSFAFAKARNKISKKL
jgi:hypothetical protein